MNCESKLPKKFKERGCVGAFYEDIFFLHEQQCSMVTTSIKMAQFVWYSSGSRNKVTEKSLSFLDTIDTLRANLLLKSC